MAISKVRSPCIAECPSIRSKSAPSDWRELDRFTFVMVLADQHDGMWPLESCASLIQVSEPPHNSGPLIGRKTSYPSFPDPKDKELYGRRCLEIRKPRENGLDWGLQNLSVQRRAVPWFSFIKKNVGVEFYTNVPLNSLSSHCELPAVSDPSSAALPIHCI